MMQESPEAEQARKVWTPKNHGELMERWGFPPEPRTSDAARRAIAAILSDLSRRLARAAATLQA